MKRGARSLVVAAHDGFVRSTAKMLEQTGCLHKKRVELLAALEYLTDKIAGTEFMERLNQSVEAGRVGKIRHVRIPYTFLEGKRLRHVRSAMRRCQLTSEQKGQIAIDRQTGKLTHCALSAKYGVSIRVIRGALGKHNRPKK